MPNKKKIKFLDIFLSLILGLGIAFIVLVVAFIALNVDTNTEDSSFLITLSSSIIYLSISFCFWLFLMRKNQLSFAEMGFKKVPVKVILKMIPLGVLLFIVNISLIIILSLTFKSLVPDNKTPLDSVVSTNDAILIGFSLILLAPFIEEFVFRGVLYRYLRQRMSIILAVIISGILFGALHDVIPVLALVGAALAVIYERYGSLYPAIVVHMVNNSLVMFFYLLTHQIK